MPIQSLVGIYDFAYGPGVRRRLGNLGFSSSVFLFYFLPLFLICYFALSFKNLALLVFSLFFYAWGEGLCVLLMIASGIGNWASPAGSRTIPDPGRA